MKKICIVSIISLALAAGSCGPGMGFPGSGTTTGATGTTTGNTTGTNGTPSTGLGDLLGGVLGALGSQQTVNSLLDLVIGKTQVTQAQLVGTWTYSAPGCAFTSEKLLAQAGGAVAAGQIKEKLAPVYKSAGIKESNTYLTFAQNGQFQGKVDGLPLNGTYVLDSAAGTIKISTPLAQVTAYVTRTTTGMAFTFESKKLLALLQMMSSLSGNTAIKTVGDLGSQFDGVRVGFDTTKTK